MKNTIQAVLIVLFLTLTMTSAYAQGSPQTRDAVAFSGTPASFSIPTGWKLVAQEDSLAAVQPISNSELIVVVAAGMYDSPEAFYRLAEASLTNQLHIQDLQLVKTPSAYRLNGMSANTADVAALNARGELVAINLRVVISADGVGVGTVVISPTAYYRQGVAAAEDILESAEFEEVTLDRQATTTTGLVGRWVRSSAANGGNRNSSGGGYSSGANVSYTFYQNGTYTYSYESFSAIDVPGLGGLSTSEDTDRGRYSVSNGKITLAGESNGSQTLTFRVIDDYQYVQIGNWYFSRD